MQTKVYEAMPRHFAQPATIGECMSASWSKIPTYYYDVRQDQYPLTTAEFDNRYNGEINVFQTDVPAANQQTNAALGAGVNEAFIALGVGVVAIGEGEAFSVPGALVNRAVGATPCFDGCIPTGGINGDTVARNATLYWGGSTWQFIEKFFQAFRLQVAIGKRYLVVDESLFDVGMTPTPPEFVGAGDSLIPAMPYIRATNDVLHDKNVNRIFIPQNQAGTLCVGSPTANVTYGHPRIIGLANRIFCFNTPLPMLPGMRFDTKFVPVQNNGVFVAGMRRASVLDAATPTTPDQDLTESLSLTCSGYSSSFTVPGGVVSLGLVFKGFALQPSAMFDYVANYMPMSAKMQEIVAQYSTVGELLAKAKYMNLAGVPADLAEKAAAAYSKIGPTG